MPGTPAPSSRATTPQTAPDLQTDVVSPMEEDAEVLPVTSPQRNQTQTDSQETPLMTSQQVAQPDQRWNRQQIRPQDQVTRTDRVSRPRFQLVLRPLAKCSINHIPKHTFAHLIGTTAPQSYLAELASHRSDTAGNCIYITVYDDAHMSRLLTVTSISFDHQGTRHCVPVEVKLCPFKPNTTRGVITIEPDETNEETLQWLRCEHAKILACTRLGRTNRAVITFDSPTLPKVVKYYMAIVKVSPYQPKRIVCYNCHNVGHMARSCPAQAVCNSCGKPHPDSEGCGPQIYCVACKEPGHIALNPTCPSRIPKPPANNPQKDATRGITWADRTREHGSDSPSSTNPSLNANNSNPKEPTMVSIMNQLNVLRADIQQLRTENQELRTENQELKRLLNDKTPAQSNSKRLPTSQTRPSRSKSTKRTPTSQPTIESPFQLALRTVRTDIHHERQARQADRKKDKEYLDNQLSQIRSLIQCVIKKLPSLDDSEEPPRKVSLRTSNQQQ